MVDFENHTKTIHVHVAAAPQVLYQVHSWHLEVNFEIG